MGSYNPALPCCCDEPPRHPCCISVTYESTCQTSDVDLGTCSVTPGTPQTVQYTRRFKKCVAKQEECNCDEFTPENTGEPSTSGIVECSAVFYEDIECNSPEAAELCLDTEKLCYKSKCGPCEPVSDGCVVLPIEEPCPPVPDCQPDPCCDPKPPRLCCCRTIANGCITVADCVACTEESASGSGGNGQVCTFVSNCTGCDLSTGFYITTVCCSSCNYALDTDGDGIGDVFGINECVYFGYAPLLTVCCDDCITYDSQGNATCVTEACVLPCSGGGVPPNLCPCPLGPFGYTCYATAPLTSRYATVGNSAEGNYMSGTIYDPSTKTYKPNNLFLFGYGYDKL